MRNADLVAEQELVVESYLADATAVATRQLELNEVVPAELANLRRLLLCSA